MKEKWQGTRILKGAVLASCFLVSGLILAGEGGSSGVGGGGDSLASQFAGIGSRVYASSWMICSAREWKPNFCFKLQGFSDALKRTKIVPREKIKGADGKAREAGNDGHSEILVNVTLFPALLESPSSAERAVRLVIHEYMVVAHQEENDEYYLSNEMVAALKKSHFSLNAIVGNVASPVLPSVQIKPCAENSNLRAVPVGFKCRTSKGVIYERVSNPRMLEAWLGPDGIVWGEFIGTATREQAKQMCRELSLQLPGLQLFERGSANGFEEVLPNMLKHGYWINGYDSEAEKVYFVDERGQGKVFTRGTTDISSVRCVGFNI